MGVGDEPGAAAQHPCDLVDTVREGIAQLNRVDRDDAVERVGRPGQRVTAAASQVNAASVAVRPGAPPGLPQHRGGRIDPADVAAGDPLGKQAQADTGAEPDDEDITVRFGSQFLERLGLGLPVLPGHEPAGDRSDQALEHVVIRHANSIDVEPWFNARVPPVTMSELSARTGKATSALRFYERRGLLASTARTSRGRIYDEQASPRWR